MGLKKRAGLSQRVYIGDMRWNITLQTPTDTISDTGAPVTTWATLANVWAHKEQTISGSSEGFEVEQQTSVTRTIWTIRARTDITAKTRILAEGVYYDIMNILNDGVTHQRLVTESRV